MDKLETLLNRPVEKVFELASRIHFGSHDSFEGWESANRSALRHIVTNVNAAEAVLEALLRSDQSGLRPQKTAIRRQDVVSALERAGCLLAPTYEDTETLKVFTSASQIGRDWPRDVGGVRILRPEFDDVMAAVAEGAKTILVKSAPGVGKTCLILDVAEQLEKEANPALLFIRGDSFDEAVKVEDLITQGLPSDIPGRVARLAESRRVVVIIDSLDVLSLSRNHTALKLFLSLLDRLAGIENVTVLTACREFDLAYDPLLRNRAWGRTVSLGLLDFDATVAPILGKWGIDPGAISETLRELLRTPKNLRLFREIRQHYSTLQLNTEQELTLAYLRETVAKNPALGTEAMETLRAISSLMLKRRSNKVPDAQAGNADLLRKLKSAGVLIQPDPHMVAFGHQTLGECLVVEGAISRGQSMADFLRTHPQLPYLRPSARAFFLYLRASDPRQLRREIWVALTSGDIAYHIKRLLVESFAGLEPDTEDRRFAIRLFNEQQLLFNNFFWKVTANGWFDFLKDDWLPLVLAEDKADEWRWKFIRRIGQWSKSQPQHALALWQRTFDEKWVANLEGLANQIGYQLSEFQAWGTPGVRKLLETLLQFRDNDDYFSGEKAFSRYVDATNDGDDLLWRSISHNVDWASPHRHTIGRTLSCDSHHFHREGFFEERLCSSDKLLTLALESLMSMQDDGVHWSPLLHATSWEARHDQSDMRHADGLTILLAALEVALKKHSKADDEWWRTNEPRLRDHSDEGLRHLLIQAYRENLPENIPGIRAQLLNPKLFRYSHLEFELGELMAESYSLLSEDDQETNQKFILTLYADMEQEEGRKPEWDAKPVYDLLLRVPPIFRTPETSSFLKQWEKTFGNVPPSPRIYSRGGMVGSPVSSSRMLALSDTDLVRILKHYENITESGYDAIEGLVGGRDMVARGLSDAASRDPERFFAIIDKIESEGLYAGYNHSILSGIADHLRYRFGRLQPPQGWQTNPPEPDAKHLALRLLGCLNKTSVEPLPGYVASHLLEACCEVLFEPEYIEQVIGQIHKILLSQQDADDFDDESLVFRAINNHIGVATGSAMRLACNFKERGVDIPESLIKLLFMAATHENPLARCMIIYQSLAFLEQEQSGLGWELFEKAMVGGEPGLWESASRFLYYQYARHFERVRPWLEKMKTINNEETAKSCGRLTSLCRLRNYYSSEELWREMDTGPQGSWAGALEVFLHNFDDPVAREELMKVLVARELDQNESGTLEFIFHSMENDPYITGELVHAYLDSRGEHRKSREFYHLLEWVERAARLNPLGVMDVLEKIASRAEEKMATGYYIHSEPLIGAMKMILQEADERDDPLLIARAIALQDRYLALDVSGMEKLFDLAVLQ